MADGRMKVNGKEYEILKLLGKGKGGYSYLAGDGAEKYVLKQIHHEPCDYYQFGNKMEAELNDYNRLIISLRILWFRRKKFIILTLSVMSIWRSGILRTGA